MRSLNFKRLFKKVFIYFIFTVLFWCLKIAFVNASMLDFENLTLTDNETLSGGSWLSNNVGYYFSNNGFRTIDFETGIVGNLVEVVDKYSYGFISYCSYDNIYQTYRQNELYSEQMNMFDTYVKSFIYSSTVPCTIKYITWKFKYDCGATGTYCNAHPRFVFYGDISDYSLRSYGYLSEPLQVDTSTAQILNQNAVIIDNIDKTNDKLDKLNDNINDNNVDSSNSTISDFFNSFNSGDTKGLQDIIILPLEYVNHLNDKCTPVRLPLGQLGDVDLPCLSETLYNKSEFANLFNILALLINGFIMYKCATSLILFINDLKNPDSDKLEVLEL